MLLDNLFVKKLLAKILAGILKRQFGTDCRINIGDCTVTTDDDRVYISIEKSTVHMPKSDMMDLVAQSLQRL